MHKNYGVLIVSLAIFLVTCTNTVNAEKKSYYSSQGTKTAHGVAYSLLAAGMTCFTCGLAACFKNLMKEFSDQKPFSTHVLAAAGGGLTCVFGGLLKCLTSWATEKPKRVLPGKTVNNKKYLPFDFPQDVVKQAHPTKRVEVDKNTWDMLEEEANKTKKETRESGLFLSPWERYFGKALKRKDKDSKNVEEIGDTVTKTEKQIVKLTRYLRRGSNVKERNPPIYTFLINNKPTEVCHEITNVIYDYEWFSGVLNGQSPPISCDASKAGKNTQWYWPSEADGLQASEQGLCRKYGPKFFWIQ